MNQKLLATKILQFRNSVSLMMPGQLNSEVGPTGLQDALQLGWVIPDTDTGYLRLTDNAGVLHEMRSLSETKCKNCDKDDCPGCDAKEKEAACESAAHDPVMKHVNRRLHETYGLGTTATSGGAPGSGQPVRAASSPAVPAPAPANPATADYTVGDDVLIAEEGKTYQAKVGSRNPDGTYVLSFGPNKPANSSQAFKRERLQRVEGTPGAPAHA